MKMQAVVMAKHGGPDALQLTEVEAPRITKPHQVLVRVRAAGVNHADYQPCGSPFACHVKDQVPEGLIPGLEGAGVVEGIGENVKRFVVGDEVYYFDGGFGAHQGSYAQYKVVDECYLARKPATLDFASAAAAPLVLITSWEALYERAQIKACDFILIHDGAGGVGHMALQLAVHHGSHVAAVVNTEDEATLAKSLGAERTIRYRHENVTAALREWSAKDGADVVFDMIGKENFTVSFDQVASYGTLVSCVASEWPRGNGTMAAFNKNIHVAFENVGLPQIAANHPGRVLQTRILETAAELFDSAKLRITLNRIYPLAEAAEAQRALEAGEIMGRVVLSIP